MEVRDHLCGLALYFGLPVCGFLESSSGLAQEAIYLLNHLAGLSSKVSPHFPSNSMNAKVSPAEPEMAALHFLEYESSLRLSCCVQWFPDVRVLMLDFNQEKTVEMLRGMLCWWSSNHWDYSQGMETVEPCPFFLFMPWT